MISQSTVPFGFALVADDVRQEIGGKTSIIGIYGNDLILPPGTELPVTIAKLAILFNWFEDPGALPKTLEFLVYLPEDKEGSPSISAPVDLPTSALDRPPALEGQRLLAHIKPSVMLSPVSLIEGLMRFRVRRDGTEWRISTLTVRVAQKSELPVFGAPPR